MELHFVIFLLSCKFFFESAWQKGFPFVTLTDVPFCFGYGINAHVGSFILVFFLIIVSYSVMIGKDQTLKVILSSYIAILASDAVSSIVSRVVFEVRFLVYLLFLRNRKHLFS